MKLKIKKLYPDAIVPTYATAGAACFDLHAADTDIGGTTVRSSRPLGYRTGLAFEVPQGYVMLIFSRSGHGFKNSTRLANCVGVIDSDYRGEVVVKLTRDDATFTHPLVVHSGDRIAQAMLVPVDQVEFDVVDDLSDTERGTGGFGSTGS